MPALTLNTPALFRPLKIGRSTLAHRVALAPLTRFRADDSHAHNDLALEYYQQRSSVPGTLLITEATPIDARAGGYANIPGIFSEEQVSAWKKIVDVVHGNGSFIHLQLWAMGRAANHEHLTKEALELKLDPSTFPYVSSGNIPLPGKDEAPRPLTTQEVQEYVSWYARAAKMAIEGAGFDAVEIHGANGYLIDQFLQTTANNRTDAYGGSIENRSRFALEVIEAVVNAVGQDRTGIRLSPWESTQGMRMEDPVPTFSYLISRIAQLYPQFAYIHLTEPRISLVNHGKTHLPESESLDFARKIWKPRPLVIAGGYYPDDALSTAGAAEQNGENVVIAFGKTFLANPDLPTRILRGIPLNPYNRDTFYSPKTPIGYIDYPFAQTQAVAA